jgi:hypothetical protein
MHSWSISSSTNLCIYPSLKLFLSRTCPLGGKLIPRLRMQWSSSLCSRSFYAPRILLGLQGLWVVTWRRQLVQTTCHFQQIEDLFHLLALIRAISMQSLRWCKTSSTYNTWPLARPRLGFSQQPSWSTRVFLHATTNIYVAHHCFESRLISIFQLPTLHSLVLWPLVHAAYIVLLKLVDSTLWTRIISNIGYNNFNGFLQTNTQPWE